MARTRVDGILLIYNHNLEPIASNMFEHIQSFPEHSQFKALIVNTHLGFPEMLRGLEFEVIVLHYSLFGWLPFSLNDEFGAYLAESESSYKVAFFQDEYRWWPERAEMLNRFRVDCVYTCIEPAYYQDTYWKYTKVPRLETYLPGYVNEAIIERAQAAIKPDAERTVDIGYRGRQSFGYMGKGAREKHEIGVGFREKAAGQSFVLDIETEEGKRIYGKQWLEFLGNCRAVLGVEAGVSIFDIDNEIFPRYERFRAQNRDESFEQVYEELLAKHDGKGIYYRTVSPRVFEAAAVRACQILYEGRYSGILEPMVHYIPLKKDFSNFDEVLQLSRDAGLRRELTENCYRDLIASGAYSYRRFMEQFDEGLIAAGLEPSVTEETIRQVSGLLARSEQSQLLKQVEAQQAEYRELMNKQPALQQQCMGVRKRLLQLFDLHPTLKTRYLVSQGLKIAALLRKRELLAARACVANALLPYPVLHRLASSVLRALH